MLKQAAWMIVSAAAVLCAAVLGLVIGLLYSIDDNWPPE